MICSHWIDSISPIGTRWGLVRITDAVFDWIARDRDRLTFASLDDRALADFGANRCDVERALTGQPAIASTATRKSATSHS